MITLYRAVCLEESEKTLHFQSLQFHRNKEKCFSPSLDWIKSRVQDGKFNNSAYIRNRYAHLLRFELEDDQISKFIICSHEWKTNIRKQVKIIRVFLHD
jgi:hypothetical protein